MKSLLEIYNQDTSPDAHGDKGTAHSYIEHYYEDAFKPYRNKNITLLEIGIAQGQSLRMWREYFTNARIIGYDIRDNGVQCPGCELVYKDATNSNSFNEINELDIIIDDGSHQFDHQLKSLIFLFDKLKSGGLYVIEDVQDIDSTAENFLSFNPNVQIFDFRNIKNRKDDIIIQILK